MPTVSIILPAFNAEFYLREAIDSMLRQTYTDFELIVIDDGSTDATREIAERVARTDSRIRLLSRENRGYTRTLNEAIDLATGRYIARMDADDISLSRRLELQVAYLDAHSRCAVVGAWIELVDPEGTTICSWHYPHEHAQIDAWHFGGRGNCLAHPAVMMRADLVRRIGKYRPELEPAEDFDLWLRLSDEHELANVPEVLLRYRMHEKSQSHLRRDRQFDRTRQALLEAARRRGMPEAPLPAPRVVGSKNARRHWIKLAHDAGEIVNARRLAVKALRRGPLSLASWRGLFVAMLGSHARPLRERLRSIGF